MKENKNGTMIPLAVLFGIAFGNIAGLLIGIFFIKDNIGIGMLIGNVAGIIAGMLLGSIMDCVKMRKGKNNIRE